VRITVLGMSVVITEIDKENFNNVYDSPTNQEKIVTTSTVVVM
jgi:hypothetical protein